MNVSGQFSIQTVSVIVKRFAIYRNAVSARIALDFERKRFIVLEWILVRLLVARVVRPRLVLIVFSKNVSICDSEEDWIFRPFSVARQTKLDPGDSGPKFAVNDHFLRDSKIVSRDRCGERKRLSTKNVILRSRLRNHSIAYVIVLAVIVHRAGKVRWNIFGFVFDVVFRICQWKIRR